MTSNVYLPDIDRECEESIFGASLLFPRNDQAISCPIQIMPQFLSRQPRHCLFSGIEVLLLLAQYRM